MTIDWLDSNPALLRDHRRAHAGARRLHDARLQRRAHLSVAGAAAGRSRALSGRRRRREARAALADLHGRHAAVPRRRLSHPLRADALAGGAAVQSGRAVGGGARSVVQYGGQLHHQHQLAELRRRKHDVLSRADARPHAPELPVGGDRHRAGGRAHPRLRPRVGQDHRQFLGRYHPLHALRPAADLRRRTRCSWSGRACRRRSAPMSMRPRWKAPSRPSRSARSPRRSRSRCSAPMAAASSTPMPRIRSRTRPRCRISCRCISIFALGAALTNVFGRMVGNQRQGWAHPRRRWACCSSPAWRSATGPKPTAPPRSTRSASPAATWKARRSASASSPRRCSR